MLLLTFKCDVSVSQLPNLMVKVLRSNNNTTSNYTLCYDDWNADWSSAMCVKIGHKAAVSTRIVPTTGLQGPWLKINSTSGDLDLAKFEQVQFCSSSYALAVDCQISSM